MSRRGAEAPPTDAEFKRLLKACDVHDEYGPRLKAMLTFCAFTGVRPGEAMALDWSDINLPALRVTISKRLYRGRTDLPKYMKVKLNLPNHVIAALDAIDAAFATIDYESDRDEALSERSRR